MYTVDLSNPKFIVLVLFATCVYAGNVVIVLVSSPLDRVVRDVPHGADIYCRDGDHFPLFQHFSEPPESVPWSVYSITISAG
jgi:hypothetical protein